MAKTQHEIRDPIHVFVRLNSDERKVLNSRPFQRLRHIHQLALTYLVYPGATHKRFEHALGVMELAGRVFDVVTAPNKLTDKVKDEIPELSGEGKSKEYWRAALQMAALCHDIGHLPFSHAAEELLPEGWDHERVTREWILSEEMRGIWDSMIPPLRAEHIAKLAVGRKKAGDLSFASVEEILSEIIVGDAFGVDRMDYLLRDSYHVGVAYGRFDHHRLVDTLRILPHTADGDSDWTAGVSLGVEEGGLQSAEALLLARYFMYSQVYFHPIRRIYDIHLQEYLSEWLPSGKFPTTTEGHLAVTDVEVLAGMREAGADPSLSGHAHAKRILEREHFRAIYTRKPTDVSVNPEAGLLVFEAAKREFGDDFVRRDHYTGRRAVPDFPVLMRDGSVDSATALSDVLKTLPVTAVDTIYVDPSRAKRAKKCLESRRDEIIQAPKEGDP